jgi:hypothetical protein
MTNHPLDDAADHERSKAGSPAQSSITHDQLEQAVIELVTDEFRRASALYKPFNSAHEGYAVLLEEVDELWDEVKKNDRTRCQTKMLAEAKQVAAMGLRFMLDVCKKALQNKLASPTHLVASDGAGGIYAGPDRRRTGCVRGLPGSLEKITVRLAGMTVYHGPERRAYCGQAKVKDFRVSERRQHTRRSGAREVAVGDDRRISVWDRTTVTPRRVYSGPERRSPAGGRREPRSDRRKP